MQPPADDEPVKARSKSRLRAGLLILGLLVLVIGGAWFYLSGGRYESTEDSSLQAGQGAVAANVSGQVITIEVHENQPVKAGQVLFRLDPKPYQAAVDEAQAKVADARAQIHSKRADVRQGEAQVGAAQAQLTYAIGEAARQKQLLSEGISSKSQYDQAVLAVQTARQAIATAAQQTQSVRAAIGGGVDVAEGNQPSVQAALAVLERAQLNLGYTVVRAPQDGVVTRVNQLQVGNYVSAAKPVFTLVGKHVWVEANFKESQLRYMRVGQPATVKIDAYADRPLRGHVKSFSPGTGNSFSLLPAENATGNWVKVVQRLPVEVEIDNPPADLLLHAGLSAEVSVDTGHVRHLFGGATQVDPKPAP
ncbi:HlyD family efflux transporter periplasmic adaptor subunit [Sphingomonas immobilis]